MQHSPHGYSDTDSVLDSPVPPSATTVLSAARSGLRRRAGMKHVEQDETSEMLLSTPGLHTPGVRGEGPFDARESPRSKLQSLLRQRSSIPQLISLEGKLTEDLFGDDVRNTLGEELMQIARRSMNSFPSMTHYIKNQATLMMEANVKRKLKAKNAVAGDLEVNVPDDADIVEAFSFVGKERRIVLITPGLYNFDYLKPIGSFASLHDMEQSLVISGCAFVRPCEEVRAISKHLHDRTRRELPPVQEAVFLEGSLILKEQSNGVFYRINFQGSFDSMSTMREKDGCNAEDDIEIMLRIRGGPWKFERSFAALQKILLPNSSLANSSQQKGICAHRTKRIFQVAKRLQFQVFDARSRSSSSTFYFDSEWIKVDPATRQGSSMKGVPLECLSIPHCAAVFDCIFDDLPWSQIERPISFAERNNRLLLLRRKNGCWGEGGRLDDRECFTPASSDCKKWALMGPNMMPPTAGLPIGGRDTWIPHSAIEGLKEDVPNFPSDGNLMTVSQLRPSPCSETGSTDAGQLDDEFKNFSTYGKALSSSGALGLLGSGFIDPPVVSYPGEVLEKIPQLRAAGEQKKLESIAKAGMQIYAGLFNGVSRIKSSFILPLTRCIDIDILIIIEGSWRQTRIHAVLARALLLYGRLLTRRDAEEEEGADECRILRPNGGYHKEMRVKETSDMGFLAASIPRMGNTCISNFTHRELDLQSLSHLLL
eukprot:764341-Hanusia_phi.AAC.1